MLSRPGTGGFTLVELLVGLTLVGVLIALGPPAMSNYLQNSKIAQRDLGLLLAIQTARTEAIRRNVLTQFVLTDAPFSTMTPASAGRRLGRPRQLRRPASRVSTPRTPRRRRKQERAGDRRHRQRFRAAFDGTIAFNGFGATMPAGSSYSSTSRIRLPASARTTAARSVAVESSSRPGGQIAACERPP